MYTDDGELIPRGTMVFVSRIPLPRGEIKNWRTEKSSGTDGHSIDVVDLFSTQVVTSTSEEGRMKQVVAGSGVEFGKEICMSIPGSTLDGDKVDRFGSLKLIAAETEKFSNENL